MSESKRSRVEDWIERATERAIGEMVCDSVRANETARATWLVGNSGYIKGRVSREVFDQYRWLELCDIFDWRKRRTPE